jgi:hypothetical protein
MAEIRRDSFTEGIKKDMYAYSLEKYPQVPPVFSQLFEESNSDSAYELGTNAIINAPLIEAEESETVTYGKAGEGYTVSAKMRTFKRAISFSQEQVEDLGTAKIVNIVTTAAGTWTEDYVRLLEKESAKIFSYGGLTAGHSIFNASVAGYTDPSGDMCYDGKPFFNLTGNKRPLYPGATATHYNGLALGIDETNLQAAYDLMTVTNNVDTNGEKIDLRPDVIVYPPSLRWTITTLLNTTGQVGSSYNDINTVKNILRPIEWQYLTDTDAWFIGNSKKGIKFYSRVKLSFDFWRDMETGGYKAKARARFGHEVNDWRYWVGSKFSTS